MNLFDSAVRLLRERQVVCCSHVFDDEAPEWFFDLNNGQLGVACEWCHVRWLVRHPLAASQPCVTCGRLIEFDELRRQPEPLSFFGVRLVHDGVVRVAYDERVVRWFGDECFECESRALLNAVGEQ